MVVDTIQNADRYLGLHPDLDTALLYLMEQAGADEPFQAGTIQLDGRTKAVYVEADTQPGPQMEVHYLYFDVHYVQKGAEHCRVGTFPKHLDYQTDKDIAFFDSEAESSFLVKEGMFYIVWPGEAHTPLCDPGETSCQVRKIICKVKA